MQLKYINNVEFLDSGLDISQYDGNRTRQKLAELIAKEEKLIPATESESNKEYDVMYTPPRETLKLSNYKAGILDLGLIKAMRSDIPNLKHVRADRSTFGEIFFDDKKPVGYYQTSHDENCTWIQAFEILPEYQGKGLSDQMLTRLLRKTNATNLSIDLDNEIAIRLYLKNGFREYARTPKMMLMCREPD